MRNKLIWVLPLAVFGLLVAGHKLRAQPNSSQRNAVSAVTAAANDFGFRLFAKLQTSQENVIISPTSLSQALSMTYNGAAGATKTGMAKALGIAHLSLDNLNNSQASLLDTMQHSDPNVQTNIANALWAQQGYTFREDFLQRNAKYYHAQVTVTDVTSPAGVKEINQWISQQTKGKIHELLKQGDLMPLTRLVLTNAVYFKGDWAAPFDKQLTKAAPFTGEDGKIKQVPMMQRTGNFPYFSNEQFQAISLPYGQGRISMVIFLPHSGKTLSGFSKQLNTANWHIWMGQFKTTECHLLLPHFKAGYAAKLNDPLAKLGMGKAFTDAADFSGMDGTRKLYISCVRHQTTLEVNEEGTVATAATGVVMTLKSIPHVESMIINRPFFFAIRDNVTGALLFMGQVVKPE